jgi:hypothetical protein
MAAQRSIGSAPGTAASAVSGAVPRHFGRQVLVIAAIAILALNGVDLVYRSLAGGPAPAAAGSRAETGFGWVEISGVETLGGLSAQDLGGMTHGISGLVPAAEATIQVAVVIGNTSDQRVRIDPAAFGLSVDGGDPIPAAGGTLTSMALRPGATVEARLSFVVPRSATSATLRFADPLGAAVVLAAGRIDTGPAPDPAPADERHDH